MVSVRRKTLYAGCLCAVLAFCMSQSAAAADIAVRVDRDPVSMDESFQLVFEAHGSVDEDPDFAPLDRDFQVMSRAESSKLSIINGSATRSHSWSLTVLPRRAGELTIPSIAFGSDHSPPLRLTVANAGTAPRRGSPGSAGGSGEVFLEVEAKPLQTWVQAEVIYTVRLYRAVQTANASLSEPEVEGGAAVIEKLGEDRNYDTQVMGRDFDVVERSYAIYPQASGAVTVKALQFQGQTGRMPFSLIDPFGPQPQTIVRQSAPVTLEVSPIPANVKGSHWLPARQLHLEDEWSKEPPEFRVGEPITRTLTLTASGLTSGQLPEIPAWAPAGFKSYPDQPVLHDAKSPSGVVGTRQEKTALIPSLAGTYELPEIRIDWWDTTSAQMQEAVLQARKITVLPGAGGQTESAPGAEANGAQPAVTTETAAAGAQPGSSAIAMPADLKLWQIACFVLAGGWLLTVLWIVRGRTRRTRESRAVDQRPSAAVRDLQQACAAGDPLRAKDALLRWAQATWNDHPPVSIGELQSHCGEALSAELVSLNRVLYANTGGSWNGKGLWNAFSTEQRAKQKPMAAAREGLEPLHRL